MVNLSPPAQLQLFGGGQSETARNNRQLIFILSGGLLLSLAVIWFTTHNIMLVGCLGGALIGLCAVVAYFQAKTAPVAANMVLGPDWSITRAVADASNHALAVTDRAGRLVCANENFDIWFAGLRAPPEIDVDASSREKLFAGARAAWRDGDFDVDLIVSGNVSRAEYSAHLRRAGTGADYLLWSFAPLIKQDIESRAAEIISGRIGRAMASAGVMALSIGAEGRVRATNPAFSLRAAGDENANIIGKDLAEYMRMDDKGRIVFEREGRRGLPLRLIQIPLAENGGDGASIVIALDDDGNSIDRASALGHIEQLLSTLPLGLALVDRDGRFLFANESFARVVDKLPEQLPPYPGDLVIAEDKAAVSESIRRFAKGQVQSGDIAVRLRDAPDDVIALSIAGVRGLGEAAVLLGLKDNSEETKLKRQVAQATKMQAIGQLAGGVAHDFNNILTAIIGYCDLMLLRHQSGDSDYDDIQQIRNNSNRAASLTRQLLAFSRQQTLRPQVLQLPDVIAEVSHLLKRLLGEKIQLEVNHGRGSGTVRADPGQLEQVIINLGVNARDAMPDGGALTIETRSISQEDVRAMGSDILPISEYVQLSVSDKGTGISKENLAKIFEPFFTTKEVGKGTGLGLSTVYGIVKQSGGYIFADSICAPSPDQGTRFDIYFPVYIGDKTDAEPPKPKAETKTRDLWGTGKILIVEDEDMVRAVAERALARQGYMVDTACDGEEGLAYFAKGRRYDLIVSDVVMPNMDGPTMVRALREQYGDCRILFMSGYAEEQLRESISLDNVYFLPKPFSVQQIAEAVHLALAQ